MVELTKLSLGINNCFAVKRFPEPEEWIKIVSSDLDLKIAQFSYDLLDPRTYPSALNENVYETVDILNKYDITIHSCFTGLVMYSCNLLLHPYQSMRIDGIQWYEKAIELAAQLNTKGCGGHIGALSCNDMKNEEKRGYLEKNLVYALSYLTKIAHLKGQQFFLWEPMPIRREPPCTTSEAKLLLKEANKYAHIPIKLCIDTGHQCPWDVTSPNELDTYFWLKQLAHESPVIHLQQTDGKGDRHWPFTKKYNQMGIIKPSQVIEAVEASEAKECLFILEVIHPFEMKESQVIKDLQTSVQYWKEFL